MEEVTGVTSEAMGFMGLLRRAGALTAVFALASAAVILGPPDRARADNYPGQADIDAASQAASSAAATVDSLDAAMVTLEQAAAAAQEAQALAADEFSGANAAAETAALTLVAAQDRAAEAEAALDQARAALAAIAQAAYRDSGSMAQVGALVGADSVDQLIVRSEAFTRSSDEADLLVQQVKAAELVATTMRDYAAQADEQARATAEQAGTALATAQDAARNADAALAEAGQVRQATVARLADLRGVSVAMEEQRQAGLEADRREQERLEFERAQAAADAASGSGAAGGGTATPKPTSTPKPTTTSTPKPTSSSRPTATSTPKPTATSTPKPTATATPTSTPKPSASATSTPKPTATPTPTPTVPTGTWKSSAANGQAAVAKALTLMGTDYQLGGNGPAYDCSGITYAAWRSAGFTIPRSSQTQYNALAKVPISQVRPGDLVFYGTNRSTTAIYHVGIYVGNGMIAEAVKPGTVAQVRAYDASWRINNLIPYVGRP